MNETEFTTVKNVKKMENNIQRKIYSPKVDLISTEKFFNVRVELPGVEKSTIKIQVKEQQIVLISGIRSSEFNDTNNSKVIYSETRYGNFIRRVKLPELIKHYFNDYKLINGVLYIEFEKQSEKQFDEKIDWVDEI
jgi:HSP20 family protein